MRVLRQLRTVSALVAVAVMGTGCASGIGNLVAKQIIKTSDVVVYPMQDAKLICTISESAVPIGGALIPLGAKSGYLATSEAIGTSANCIEEQANELDVVYQRALKNKQYDEAHDAIIKQKSLMSLASQRYYLAVRYAEKYFGPLGGACPRFVDINERVRFSVVLTSAAAAIMTNMASENSNGVPLDLLSKAMVSSGCIGDLWGIGSTLRGTALVANKSLLKDNEDPWVYLERGLTLAQASGVRIGHTLYATAADMAQDEVKLRKALKMAGQLSATGRINKAYMAQDAMALIGLRKFSDRIWAKQTGHRTPFNQLGTFPEDKASETTVADDSLLAP